MVKERKGAKSQMRRHERHRESQQAGVMICQARHGGHGACDATKINRSDMESVCYLLSVLFPPRFPRFPRIKVRITLRGFLQVSSGLIGTLPR